MANILVGIIMFFCDVGMVFGAVLSYVVQIHKMWKERVCEGFSTYVSFILILSNLIRLFWWYLAHFSTIILMAAILMVICQMILLYIWVQINNLPEDQKNVMMKKQKKMKMESEFIQNAQSQPRQNFGEILEHSTNRDDEGNVVQTKYQLDNNDFEETGSTKYSEQELSTTRSLMNESNMSSNSLEDNDNEEPEVVPFDQVVDAEDQSSGNKAGQQVNAALRRSLIDTVTDESTKIVDMLESNAMIKVNAFNSSDQDQADQFVQRFWYWRHYSSYLLAFFVMNAILTILTYIFQSSNNFKVLLGVLSSSIEALLGLPQFLLNFQKKSTHGLAFLLIAMWTWGDFYKFVYYLSINGPTQLICSSVFQLSVDVGIMSQFYIYRKNRPGMENNDSPPAAQK